MAITWDEWLAVASIALPLIAKAASDWSANQTAGHNAALARIVGMAGRQAATAARVLATAKPGTDAAALEQALIKAATETVVSEMDGSMATLGATPLRVQRIVQGELDKVMATPVIAIPVPGPDPIPSIPGRASVRSGL